MQRLFSVFITAFILVCGLAGGASNKVELAASFEQKFREQGYVACVPPAGDPGNRADWQKLGPGAVIIATHIVRQVGIHQARFLKEQSAVSLFDHAIKVDVNLSANGGFAVSEAAKIQAVTRLVRNTEVDVIFGKTREATVFNEVEFRKMLRAHSAVVRNFCKGLRNDQFHVIKSAIYTPSFKFTFKQRAETGMSIPSAQATDIATAVQNAKIVNGGGGSDSPFH